MPDHTTLISTIAVSFAVAFLFGVIANRLRLPPLVGYLLAGVAIGPFTPGYTADAAMAGQLAEIGVMLLMFGVGLHFSAADLLAVRWIAIPGALLQIVLATVIGVLMALAWGWSLGAGLVLGLCLSVGSTVVLLKALEERNSVATPNGRIAVGWLIVEDLAMVLVLVLLPAFAVMLGGHAVEHAEGPTTGLLASITLTLVKVTAFVMISLFFGPRVLPWVLRQVARTGSRELFTLSVLAIALGIAFGASELFGVSFALGAFFAGVVLSESDLSHRAAANSLPLQDAFAVLFFVSVGMLCDPAVVVRHPWMVIEVLALILVGKAVLSLGTVMALGFPISTALTMAASLAQVGEFSFILAGLGIAHGLLPAEGLSLILAGSVLSISVNPLMFAAAEKARAWIEASPRVRLRFEERRGKRMGSLMLELETARRHAEEKAREHRTFGPEELVQRFPLFAKLNAEQRETLVLHFKTFSAEPGQRIIRKGDKADSVYFISSGQVEVAVKRRKIKLEAGAFFGEMALLTGARRSADVTTLDFSKFLTLSQRDFREFLRKHPQVRADFADLAEKRGEMNRAIPDEATRPPVAFPAETRKPEAETQLPPA